MNIYDIVERLKKDTNNAKDIIYREKTINKKQVYVIYNEPLVSSNKVSDYIFRSLTSISKLNTKSLLNTIENNISNFKVEKVTSYEKICFYLHRGFTIILVDGEKEGLVLETKGELTRSIGTPSTENTIRGPKDAFVEEYQKNIGLIRKRIKSNDLWIDNIVLGKYTNTQIGILYINKVVKKELVKEVKKRLKKIDIYGIINSGMLKNLMEKENKSIFPTMITTERPDAAVSAMLEGKVVIVVDNAPFVLIIPAVLNDFIKMADDSYSKSINVSFTRYIRFISLIIAVMVPALYVALITYNQEIIPTELLVNFAIQRNSVPFPAFFEAIIMMISFEILRESDLRVPSFTGSSLSIVGALILGEAAVNAGIVSPIMIIVIALTAISSLPFSEPELINGIRLARFLFMIGASLFGIVGIVIVFIYFMTKLVSMQSFGKPYLLPYAPTSSIGMEDGVIETPIKMRIKRKPYLSDNRIKQRIENNEEN